MRLIVIALAVVSSLPYCLLAKGWTSSSETKWNEKNSQFETKRVATSEEVSLNEGQYLVSLTVSALSSGFMVILHIKHRSENDPSKYLSVVAEGNYTQVFGSFYEAKNNISIHWVVGDSARVDYYDNWMGKVVTGPEAGQGINMPHKKGTRFDGDRDFIPLVKGLVSSDRADIFFVHLGKQYGASIDLTGAAKAINAIIKDFKYTIE